jgi:hypothetical protein
MRVVRPIGALLGTAIFIAMVVVWWTARPPRRPAGLSTNALYMERGIVPFKLSSTPGDWLDCWFDKHERLDRCRLTDERGNLEFEDVFLPYEGQSPLPQEDLVLDRRATGHVWTGSYEKGLRYPLIHLANGQILLPRSDYEKAKQTVDWSKGKVGSP